MFLSAYVFLKRKTNHNHVHVSIAAYGLLSLLIRNNVDVSECDDICEDWTPASSSSEPDEPSSLDCFFFLVSGSFPSASFPLPSSFFLFSSSPLLDLSSVALFLFRSDSAVSLNGEKQ